ncbi:hypothetical protein OP10G_2453 [Fimbriimonas ginsengisoli Gsoil 348]|uniref:Uncharacterized protein n=1 Tax=Fimbriimonas ginsengisoli Gsoil 348 TaxID=661478 RepID=A0A068NQV2_FIMGI|nr:hypothetical protein OP10G_2453 [Fimbriimonas ginsengisoli Gsoil 348]
MTEKRRKHLGRVFTQEPTYCDELSQIDRAISLLDSRDHRLANAELRCEFPLRHSGLLARLENELLQAVVKRRLKEESRAPQFHENDLRAEPK